MNRHSRLRGLQCELEDEAAFAAQQRARDDLDHVTKNYWAGVEAAYANAARLMRCRRYSYAWLREHTLCKVGRHCDPAKRVQRYDGGKLPQLCCYCRLIIAWGRMEREGNRKNDVHQP